MRGARASRAASSEASSLRPARAGTTPSGSTPGARQPAALALFFSAGYLAIGDYNGNPFASHWLEKRLTSGGV
jgi:hypothetical protein